MTAQPIASVPSLSAPQRAAIDAACAAIAPTWPLDRLIAVNPWWPLRDQPFGEVAARLGYLGRVRAHMPAAYYRDAWQSGRISPTALRAALDAAGLTATTEQCLAALDAPDPGHWHTVGDWIDNDSDRHGKMAWCDEITHQISQFCADVFQRHAAEAQAPGELYRAWRDALVHDAGVATQMGEPGLAESLARLPERADSLLARALDDLGIPDDRVQDGAHALLLDINGWASWVAYERWQGELDRQPLDRMTDLLAIRLGWDWVLWHHYRTHHPKTFGTIARDWRRQVSQAPAVLAAQRDRQRWLWVWQRALEWDYQAPLIRALKTAGPARPRTEPTLQAVFCIDVRSEVIRRALEAQDAGIETLGYAGFFGLPLAYQAEGSEMTRPQLPGLLAPAVRVRRQAPAGAGARRNRRARWLDWGHATPATFTLVEATGLSAAFGLLRRSLAAPDSSAPFEQEAGTGDWVLEDEQGVLGPDRQAALAAGVLRSMGLTRSMAPRVLLIGHGSHSANNPHAAGLDCGACGGQSGEVNVRVLAQMLNDPEVRRHLADQGVAVPASTRFVAGLHNTTTDDITLFDADPALAGVRTWLDGARRRAQRERAPTLGLAGLDEARLDRALRRRARDWSQVRPEWGLAGNAAFLIGPRDRSRHLDLGGRAFLHDYRAEDDPDGSILEGLLTAPMIVTNWINLQYYASTTDPLTYGSGNKVLHNVVGGHIGVFEGNGGDLRIGLPRQSVHDGTRWRHEPVRLSVFVAAPRERIQAIVERHDAVRDLVDNDWLYLFAWDADGAVARYQRRTWRSW